MTSDRPLARVALATDFAEDGEALFSTSLGLALAAARGGPVSLYMLHVGPARDWRSQPKVRDQLVRWGMLDPADDLDAFRRLGVQVRPVPLSGEDIRHVLLGEIDVIDPGLLVLGTHGYAGLDRLLHPSIAEPVARASLVPTLIVRTGAERLIDPETGGVRLRRVVVPIDTRAPVQPVLDALVALVGGLDASPVSFTFVHIGGAAGLPSVTLPARTDWAWRTDLVAGGGTVDGILAVADAVDADLVAMGTQRHDSVLDALRGSTTERVVRRASCPVLAVPVG